MLALLVLGVVLGLRADDRQPAASYRLLLDGALHEGAADRARRALGYPPKPLRHPGAGISIAWAFGGLGIPSFLVELESVRGDR